MELKIEKGIFKKFRLEEILNALEKGCLLYTSDAADDQ